MFNTEDNEMCDECKCGKRKAANMAKCVGCDQRGRPVPEPKPSDPFEDWQETGGEG